MTTLSVQVRLWSPGDSFEFTLSPGALPQRPAVEAQIERILQTQHGDKEVVERITLDKVAWNAFRYRADIPEFLADANTSGPNALRRAVEAQLNWMTNSYTHDADGCDEDWTDSHSCACDDECPNCGAAISPTSTDEHVLLAEVPDRPGLYGLTGDYAHVSYLPDTSHDGSGKPAAPRPQIR